jgi:hypothetical protein
MHRLRAIAAPVLLFLVALPVRAQQTSPELHVDTVSFHGDIVLVHSRASAARLNREFAEYIAAMPPLPGLPAANTAAAAPINVYLAGDESDFAAMTGGAAPHWGAGIAQPDSGIIVLPGYTSRRAGVQDLGPVIRHEIAHIELQRALSGLRIPRWFTEGYAVWSAGQLDPDAGWYLRVAFITQRAPPLDSLELSWPRGEADARVAYLLSASAVSFLYSLGPDSAFAALIESWRDTGSFETALRSTYRISSTQFEQLWAKDVRRNYGWLLFVAQGSVIWLFFTIVAVVLVAIRRRRDRQRLEVLRRTEPPDAPAYWIEEPLPEPPHEPPHERPTGGESDRVP